MWASAHMRLIAAWGEICIHRVASSQAQVLRVLHYQRYAQISGHSGWLQTVSYGSLTHQSREGCLGDYREGCARFPVCRSRWGGSDGGWRRRGEIIFMRSIIHPFSPLNTNALLSVEARMDWIMQMVFWKHRKARSIKPLRPAERCRSEGGLISEAVRKGVRRCSVVVRYHSLRWPLHRSIRMEMPVARCRTGLAG